MDKMKRFSNNKLDALEAAVMRDDKMSDIESDVLSAIQELRMVQRIAAAAQEMMTDGGHSRGQQFAEIVYKLNQELKTYFKLEEQ
jgi:hypothetical protein